MGQQPNALRTGQPLSEGRAVDDADHLRKGVPAPSGMLLDPEHDVESARDMVEVDSDRLPPSAEGESWAQRHPEACGRPGGP